MTQFIEPLFLFIDSLTPKQQMHMKLAVYMIAIVVVGVCWSLS